MMQGGISPFQLLIIVFLFFLFFAPPITVLFSKRARGWSKFVWFLMAGWFSWIGYYGYAYFAFKKDIGSN